MCMCCRCSRPFLDSLCCRFKDRVGFSERCYDFHPAVLLTDPVNEFPSFELLQFRTPNDQKRPGEVICKGHKSYKLVRALQLGIRYFMDWKMDAPKKELAALDFRNNASIVVRFPSDGARHSSDMFTDFKWKDYRPAVFRHLQELNKINTDEYMLSICGNETLRELTSPGKSGSLLYLSNDDRFVIKTVRKSEKKVLLEMLPNYYRHVQKYENTLLTRFYGLHAVQQSGSRKVYFVVMENIFYSGLRIHKRFDLKGSSQGRCASKVTADESTIFKDLDLDFAFFLDPSMRQKLLRQIKRDCNFLEVEGIMDYSLLLGIHISSKTHDSPAKEPIDGNTLASKTSPRCDSFENRNEQTKSCNDLLQNPAAWPDCKLGVRMPAYATPIGNPKSVGRSSRHRATAGKDPNVVLYIGIIDILQGYNMFKRIEHVYKSLQFDSQSISAVNPKVYSSRFQDFLTKVFPIKEQHFLRCDRKSSKQNC